VSEGRERRRTEEGVVFGGLCRKWSGGEVRRGKNKAELEYEKREKVCGACQQRIGKKS
jgi:hypothetical protein